MYYTCIAIILPIGIEIQNERIPLRFLIKQLHDGYRIVCTGELVNYCIYSEVSSQALGIHYWCQGNYC